MEFVSHKKHLSTLSDYSPCFLTAARKDVLRFQQAWAGREKAEQHVFCAVAHTRPRSRKHARSTWACMFGCVSINPHWPPENSELTCFYFFLVFLSLPLVLSETTDHGSSKCDKWVVRSFTQIRSCVHYTPNLNSNSAFVVLCSLFCSLLPGDHQRRQWWRWSCDAEGEG